MKWDRIEKQTWAAMVPGGMLIRYVDVPYDEKTASSMAMVFVPVDNSYIGRTQADLHQWLTVNQLHKRTDTGEGE